jgi:pimeloyl-ACP methyl ester carboxylesterase
MAIFPIRAPARRSSRRIAALSLVPLGLLGGYVGGRSLRAAPPPPPPLPPALFGDIEHLHTPFGAIAYYRGGVTDGAPLLLVHSINAAANSYEVKPLYDHYRARRAVYALELPGFGFSDRPDRIYTPRLMTDAIIAMVEAIRERHGAFPIDALAVSVSAEFLARAASEHPTLFRTIALTSPSGFSDKRPGDGPPGSTFAMPALRDIVSFPAWGPRLFGLLVSRPSLRFFLRKTWGSSDIDEGLLDYDAISARQPGAEHAPFSFIGGFLFSGDIMNVYKTLTLPVWMTHGIRGDFVDYRRKVEVQDRPNWTVRVFPTGAMSYFERLDDYTAGYDDFLDRVA